MYFTELTQRGKTVVCTIHQPSSETFAMFDRLVLLAEGRIAYQGSSSGALGFFERLIQLETKFKLKKSFNGFLLDF